MKGLKIWAMLGGFAVAASCCATTALADETKKGVGTQAPFNELEAGKNKRGVRLDELFEYFKKGKTVPTNVQVSTTVPVKETVAKRPVQRKQQPAIANKKVPIVAIHKTAPSAVKPKSGGTSPIQTAEYHSNGNDATAFLAVSSGGSGQTPIISASLDRPGALPKYKAGERMTVKLQANQDCNVLVFDYDSKGTLTQLYPNEYETKGSLKAGETVEIGGADSKYTLDIGGKGIERIFVYAYPTSEQPITVAMTSVPRSPFRSVEITPDQYKALVAHSRVYFEGSGHDRSVKVMPKAGAQQVSTASVENDKQPNKLELTFQIDNK